MIKRIKWINEHTPDTAPKLTLIEDGGIDYLLLWPGPDEHEQETGEWDKRILAVDQYKEHEIGPRLDGAEHMIYIMTWQTRWE